MRAGVLCGPALLVVRLRAMALEMAAGPHVRDLLSVEETWRQIRPRYVLPEGERVTTGDVENALKEATAEIAHSTTRRGSNLGDDVVSPILAKRPSHACVVSCDLPDMASMVSPELAKVDLLDFCRSFTDDNSTPRDATASPATPATDAAAGPYSRYFKQQACRLQRQRVMNTLRARDHYKVYAGVNMSEQAQLWRSATIDAVMDAARAREIEMPEVTGGRDGAAPCLPKPFTFGMIFDMLAAHNIAAYVYGGAIRDIFMDGPTLAEDVDVLFACDAQRLAELGEATFGWVKNVHYKFKQFENSEQERMDYISVGDQTTMGREKFSGHKLDANCAGEFTFNCLLYDMGRRVLIDATGWGIRDAITRKMRIPYDGGRAGEWDAWSQNCDRLPAMSSLRFLNFRSRGWEAPEDVVTHIVWWMVNTADGAQANPAVESLHQPRDATVPPAATTITDTVTVFLKRKVLKVDVAAIRREAAATDTPVDAVADRVFAKAAAKLATFKSQLVKDFDLALSSAGVTHVDPASPGSVDFARSPGLAWFAEHVAPIAEELTAKQRRALAGSK